MQLLYFNNPPASLHHLIKVEAILPGLGDRVEVAARWLERQSHICA